MIKLTWPTSFMSLPGASLRQQLSLVERAGYVGWFVDIDSGHRSYLDGLDFCLHPLSSSCVQANFAGIWYNVGPKRTLIRHILVMLPVHVGDATQHLVLGRPLSALILPESVKSCASIIFRSVASLPHLRLLMVIAEVRGDKFGFLALNRAIM